MNFVTMAIFASLYAVIALLTIATPFVAAFYSICAAASAVKAFTTPSSSGVALVGYAR